MRKRKRDILDNSSVPVPALQTIFNIGEHRMRQYWLEVVRHEVRWVQTSNGPRVVLVDVMRFAFPEFRERTIGLMCIEYLFKLAELRKKAKQPKKE